MESRAKILGHSAHQILIVFPLGLLATAVIFDLIFATTQNAAMAQVSYWVMAAGIVGGLVAAPFGLVDWWSVPAGTRAAKIGMVHGLVMFAVILLFTASWLMRVSTPDNPSVAAIAISVVGGLVASVGGWLGGELVCRLGVGVDDDANLNAPSSLRRHVPVRVPRELPPR
jgi:uncharacterized membrane protein